MKCAFFQFLLSISSHKKQKTLRSFANWTGILKKFRLNFTSSKRDVETDESASSNLPTQQLRALFRLHSNMNVDKSLINLQLAATHISFMLQLHTNQKVRPKRFLLILLRYFFFHAIALDYPRFSWVSSRIPSAIFEVSVFILFSF
jgi:hypothetical protein